MAKVMSDSVTFVLKEKANEFRRRFKQMKTFSMTHQEVLDLTAPSYHHELLRTAAKVANVSASQGTMEVYVPYVLDGIERPQIDLRMVTFEGREPPLMPRNPEWQPCALTIQRKVTDWYDHYLRIGRMCATVRWVVDHLNEICDNGHQIRARWPAVLHLAAKSGDEKVEKWIEKYGVRVATRSMPSITRELRQILTETSEWCAQGVLLEEIKDATMGEVTISWGKQEPFLLNVGGKYPVQLSRDGF